MFSRYRFFTLSVGYLGKYSSYLYIVLSCLALSLSGLFVFSSRWNVSLQNRLRLMPAGRGRCYFERLLLLLRYRPADFIYFLRILQCRFAREKVALP